MERESTSRVNYRGGSPGKRQRPPILVEDEDNSFNFVASLRRKKAASVLSKNAYQ